MRQDSASESPIDRRIGDSKSGIEISDEEALVVFEALGIGKHDLRILREMQPFDQKVIDLAIDGLAAAVVGDQTMQDLANALAETATVPLRRRSARFTLHKAAIEDRFNPGILQRAIDNRLDGVGQGPRVFAGQRITPRLREIIIDHKQGF